MAFQIQKISDVGTSHPVVARLGVQTGNLSQWLGVEKQQSDEIVGLYIRTLSRRLVRCFQFRDSLLQRLKIDADRVNAAPRQPMPEIPYVVDLEGLVESFLYEAKNYLRDLVGVFRSAFGAKFKDASALADLKKGGDCEVLKWAEEKFGAEGHLANMLRSEGDWIAEIIRKRNALEHPGGYSGNLIVNNVRAHPINIGGFITPSWHRSGQEESDILGDMDILLDNLLTFAEDILAFVALETSPFKQIRIAETPPEERDLACPIRLSVTVFLKGTP
jgi:hypothetical protein